MLTRNSPYLIDLLIIPATKGLHSAVKVQNRFIFLNFCTQKT